MGEQQSIGLETFLNHLSSARWSLFASAILFGRYGTHHQHVRAVINCTMYALLITISDVERDPVNLCNRHPTAGGIG